MTDSVLVAGAPTKRLTPAPTTSASPSKAPSPTPRTRRAFRADARTSSWVGRSPSPTTARGTAGAESCAGDRFGRSIALTDDGQRLDVVVVVGLGGENHVVALDWSDDHDDWIVVRRLKELAALRSVSLATATGRIASWWVVRCWVETELAPSSFGQHEPVVRTTFVNAAGLADRVVRRQHFTNDDSSTTTSADGARAAAGTTVFETTSSDDGGRGARKRARNMFVPGRGVDKHASMSADGKRLTVGLEVSRGTIDVRTYHIDGYDAETHGDLATPPPRVHAEILNVTSTYAHLSRNGTRIAIRSRYYNSHSGRVVVYESSE